MYGIYYAIYWNKSKSFVGRQLVGEFLSEIFNLYANKDKLSALTKEIICKHLLCKINVFFVFKLWNYKLLTLWMQRAIWVTQICVSVEARCNFSLHYLKILDLVWYIPTLKIKKKYFITFKSLVKLSILEASVYEKNSLVNTRVWYTLHYVRCNFFFLSIFQLLLEYFIVL